MVWQSYEAVGEEVKAFRPDVVHVHNTFPLLSPSVYYAVRRNGVCVVQTLHNYRIGCANGLLLRNGMPCEDCVGRAKWRGTIHRCYNGSAGISASVVALKQFTGLPVLLPVKWTHISLSPRSNEISLFAMAFPLNGST